MKKNTMDEGTKEFVGWFINLDSESFLYDQGSYCFILQRKLITECDINYKEETVEVPTNEGTD